MILHYYTLSQHPNIFLKMTGLRVAEFDTLLRDILPAYLAAESARLARPQRQRAQGGGRDSELDVRNQILLTIVWLRQYPTHEVLGYLFGVSQPTAGRYIRHVLPVLEQAGRDTMRMPDPGRKQRCRLPDLLRDTPELAVIVDSFEQKVQRPQDQTERDGWYSGKKRSHTLKSQVAVDEDTGQIVHVSQSVSGRTHDMPLLKPSGLLDACLAAGCGGAGGFGVSGAARLASLGGDAPQETARQAQGPPARGPRLQPCVFAAAHQG
jgi:Helix-turn-helix of DDE superfamily endonuclease/DDE superfamily endonuclease